MTNDRRGWQSNIHRPGSSRRVAPATNRTAALFDREPDPPIRGWSGPLLVGSCRFGDRALNVWWTFGILALVVCEHDSNRRRCVQSMFPDRTQPREFFVEPTSRVSYSVSISRCMVDNQECVRRIMQFDPGLCLHVRDRSATDGLGHLGLPSSTR